MRYNKILIIGNVGSSMVNFRKELIVALTKQGLKVYCLARNYTSSEKEYISKLGAEAIESPLNSKGMNPFKDIIAILKLIKIIKKLEVNIVFSFFVKPVLFGSLAAKLAGVERVVGMIEGLGNAFTISKEGNTIKHRLIQKIQLLLYKTILPFLDYLIFLNKDDKEDLLDCHNIHIKNYTILGGIGVDMNYFTYSEAPIEPISFIFIGRFLKEKGIFEYLEAVTKVKNKYPKTIFYLLGDFDEGNPFSLKRKDLEEYIKSDIIVYPGYVSNVKDYLVRASVSVCTSYREGFPRVAQEASAIGRAIITSDCVGGRETVKEGLNGFIIPLFDVEFLVEKMEFFIENPQEIVRMGKESHNIAEKYYDINEVNQRLMKILLIN